MFFHLAYVSEISLPFGHGHRDNGQPWQSLFLLKLAKAPLAGPRWACWRSRPRTPSIRRGQSRCLKAFLQTGLATSIVLPRSNPTRTSNGVICLPFSPRHLTLHTREQRLQLLGVHRKCFPITLLAANSRITRWQCSTEYMLPIPRISLLLVHRLTSLQDDPIYPSTVTSQRSSTGDYDHAGLATWTSWMKTNPQRSHFHHELDEASDGFTLDPTLYDAAIAEPVLPLILEDELLAWDWAALNVQPTLDRNQQPSGPSNYEVSSRSPAYDPQNFARLSSWSDADADLNLAWTNPSTDGANTEINELPLDNDRAATSPLAPDDAQTKQRPIDWPGLNLDRSSSSTTSPISTEYPHSTLSRADTLSSSVSPVAEDQGKEPGSRQSPASQKASCWTTSLPSVTTEADLSRSFKKRQSKTDDRQQGPFKKSREMPTRKMARHSVIEKRYRTKLNDELGRLRNNVPSLRVKPKRSEEYAYREGKEKLDRPEASSKFDKATVVSKAIEYITYIELCNKRLSQEQLALIDRLSAIETMASADW